MRQPSALLLALVVLRSVCAGSMASISRRLPTDLPCQEHNSKLQNWLSRGLEDSASHLVPRAAADFDAFIVEVKDALDAHVLAQRPIVHLFSPKSEFHPTCAGDWLEFGVAFGGTVNAAAEFRKTHCSPLCPSVFGFDTFTGLPEVWKRDDAHAWKVHEFDQGGDQGKFPKVGDNVELVKGLFNESIPQWLHTMDAYAGKNTPISYLHVDCDLYAGSKDIFTKLNHKIEVGTVIVFDELINYQYFKEHEMLAFWEWVSTTGTKLLPIGVKGPIHGKTYGVDLDPAVWAADAAPWEQQSAGEINFYYFKTPFCWAGKQNIRVQQLNLQSSFVVAYRPSAHHRQH